MPIFSSTSISSFVLVQGTYFNFGNRFFAVITFLFPCANSLQLELVAYFSGVRPAGGHSSIQALNFLVYLPSVGPCCLWMHRPGYPWWAGDGCGFWC